MEGRRSGLRALSLGMLLVVLGCGVKAKPAGGTVAAPKMTLRYLDGTSVELSELRGKVVLLNFWATWCPPCRAEVPEFEDLHRAYAGEGLAVVGVSMDRADEGFVREFAKEFGISYPIALGPFEEMEHIWAAVGGIPTVEGSGEENPVEADGTVHMMPTTFVIDKEGKVYRKHVGPRTRSQLEPEVRLLMGLGASVAL